MRRLTYTQRRHGRRSLWPTARNLVGKVLKHLIDCVIVAALAYLIAYAAVNGN